MYRVSNAMTHWGQVQDDVRPGRGVGPLLQCQQELSFLHCFIPRTSDSS